jgi:hypothetical protein
MNAKVTYAKDEYGDWLFSTGQRVAKYQGTQLWGRGSTGWYITEADGEFKGIKFDSFKDAKEFIIQRANPMQYTEIVLERSAKTLAKYAQTI